MQYPRVQAKGASEVEVLYREHRDRLWRAVFLFCRDREMASDSVAEAFAQALRNEKTIRSVLPWVWRAAFAIAAGELKRRGRVTTANREGLVDIPEDAMVLAEALGRLPERDREALILRYVADLSLREIAAITGRTSAAVGMRLTRAKRKLRNLLEDDDD